MAPTRKITMASLVPVHDVLNSSPISYIHSLQQIVEEKSISRSNSGASSDLYFPGDVGFDGKEDKLPLHTALKSNSGASNDFYFPDDLCFNGKEDKQPLHSSLKDPIWVTPSICTHQGTGGEMCFMCKREVEDELEKSEYRHDFTVLNVYGTRRPTKRCKCGTITSQTTCLLVFLTMFISAFVIYIEVFIKQQSSVTVHYKM